LAGGLRPDPLGELRRSPRPLVAETGKGERNRDGKGKGREGKGKGGGRETEGHIMSPQLFLAKLRQWIFLAITQPTGLSVFCPDFKGHARPLKIESDMHPNHPFRR